MAKIKEMASNVRELTTEYSTCYIEGNANKNYPATYRGGEAGATGSYLITAGRSFSKIDGKYSNIGFRCMMYLK